MFSNENFQIVAFTHYLNKLKKNVIFNIEHNPSKYCVEFGDKKYKKIKMPYHSSSENLDTYLKAYETIAKRNKTLKNPNSEFEVECDTNQLSRSTKLEDSPPNLVVILKFLMDTYEFKGTKFIDLPVFFE
jgi:hypothetical protein